jgi:predicted nuclease of predicted toxin-antitoxin system
LNLVCDEGVERAIVERLRNDGHAVIYIAELSPGVSDDAVLVEAHRLEAPLITKDKDFGELVFRQGLASFGVVLLRLDGLPATRKSEIVAAVVADRSTEILRAFSVISPGQIRIRPSL